MLAVAHEAKVCVVQRQVVQFAEVIHLVVRLDAIDNSFDGSAASSGDHTVVHVREDVDGMGIPILEGRFYSAPFFLFLCPLFNWDSLRTIRVLICTRFPVRAVRVAGMETVSMAAKFNIASHAMCFWCTN